MSTPVMEEVTLSEADIDSPTPCESDHCAEVLHKPSHEAEYIGWFPCCTFSYFICQERAEMFLNQMVTCNCGKTIDGTTITTMEIPR